MVITYNTPQDIDTICKLWDRLYTPIQISLELNMCIVKVCRIINYDYVNWKGKKEIK